MVARIFLGEESTLKGSSASELPIFDLRTFLPLSFVVLIVLAISSGKNGASCFRRTCRISTRMSGLNVF